MTKYVCAVKLDAPVDGSPGWFGTVEAEHPAAAAAIARGHHSPGSPCYAAGDRIAYVEVLETDGTRIGNY